MYEKKWFQELSDKQKKTFNELVKTHKITDAKLLRRQDNLIYLQVMYSTYLQYNYIKYILIDIDSGANVSSGIEEGFSALKETLILRLLS